MLISVSNLAASLCGELATAFPSFNFHMISPRQLRVESEETISVGPLVRLIENEGSEVIEARRLRPSLEEVFVQVTGIELDAMKKEQEKSSGVL
jgi:ABC-2 type transport system ATP-binding protein